MKAETKREETCIATKLQFMPTSTVSTLELTFKRFLLGPI